MPGSGSKNWNVVFRMPHSAALHSPIPESIKPNERGHLLPRRPSSICPMLSGSPRWPNTLAIRRTFVGEQFVGGAMELSQDLKKLVAKNPERFSALVNQMEATLPPTYFEAILKGLSDNGNGSGRAGTLEQVCSVLRRIRDLGVQVHGVEVGWAIGALSEEALPDDIVEMLCRVALYDRDPESDDWHRARDEESPIDQAINSARGAAATALSRLLSADRSRWNILKTTIGHLVEDRVLAVRSVAVESLLAILDTHRSDAFAYFKRLAEGAGPILEVWPESHWPGFALRQADVFQSYTHGSVCNTFQ